MGWKHRENAGGPKLTWSSFRGFDSIFADYMSASQSLCLRVSIALILTWKIPVKQRFDPANTEGDTFCSAWWKRDTQMQRTRSLQGLSHMFTLTHATMTKEAKMLKVTDMNKCWGGPCEERMLPNQHTWNTHSTHSGLGWLFFLKKIFWTITYKLILKYDTLKGKQADINMCGERQKAFKIKSAQY